MGVLSSPQACKQIRKMMKNVAVVALCLFAAAVAEPEADAGYHYGHLGYAHHGYYGYPYGHHGYYGHHYGKRSADAEPTAAAEADADAYYGYGYGHLGYAHHGYYGYPMPTTVTTATTTARDPLMLSPRPLLRLMLTTATDTPTITDTLTTDTTDIPMPTTATTATIINLFDYLLRVEDC